MFTKHRKNNVKKYAQYVPIQMLTATKFRLLPPKKPATYVFKLESIFRYR